MPRARRGFKARQRRNKVLKLAKGYVGGRRRLFRSATETVQRALAFAYRDRKVKKRDFRRLWVVRISAACTQNGTSYSKFMGGLKKASVDLDRKILADLAVRNPEAFTKLVAVAKG